MKRIVLAITAWSVAYAGGGLWPEWHAKLPERLRYKKSVTIRAYDGSTIQVPPQYLINAPVLMKLAQEQQSLRVPFIDPKWPTLQFPGYKVTVDIDLAHKQEYEALISATLYPILTYINTPDQCRYTIKEIVQKEPFTTWKALQTLGIPVANSANSYGNDIYRLVFNAVKHQQQYIPTEAMRVMYSTLGPFYANIHTLVEQPVQFIAAEQNQAVPMATEKNTLAASAASYPKHLQHKTLLNVLRDYLPCNTSYNNHDQDSLKEQILLIAGLHALPSHSGNSTKLHWHLQGKELWGLNGMQSVRDILKEKKFLLSSVDASYNHIETLTFDHFTMPELNTLNVYANPLRNISLHNFTGSERFTLIIHKSIINEPSYTTICKQLWPYASKYPQPVIPCALKATCTTMAATLFALSLATGICAAPFLIPKKLHIPLIPDFSLGLIGWAYTFKHFGNHIGALPYCSMPRCTLMLQPDNTDQPSYFTKQYDHASFYTMRNTYEKLFFMLDKKVIQPLIQ